MLSLIRYKRNVIKTIIREHYTPTRTAEIKKTNEDVGQQQL